jgi:glycine dehydrogenase
MDKAGKIMKINLKSSENFDNRHIGPDASQVRQMLDFLGLKDLEQLIEETIPASIRLKVPLQMPEAISEIEFLNELKRIASKNRLFKSYIGLGYYDTITPAVIQRNILENPGWYTAYTPYQAEISQGRLEALINYQTMVTELTGMELANASLLDEGTAAAEAMTLLHGLRKGNKKNADKFLVDVNLFPQTLEVLKTRARPAGIRLEINRITPEAIKDPEVFGMMIQYPDANGRINDWFDLVHKAKDAAVFSAFSADLLSLAILTPPGELGADVVTGTTQRFGVPMGYGGPHAAYFATREVYKRNIPGRIIGVSVDADGNKAYRMALQTREQHIRREKATSNICTAQVLLAVMAGMYAVYHGPAGLKRIAMKIHGLSRAFAALVADLGYNQENDHYFDTLKIQVMPGEKNIIRGIAEEAGMNMRYFDTDHIGVSLDEKTSYNDVVALAEIFAQARSGRVPDETIRETEQNISIDLPDSLLRKSSYLTHPVFNTCHSEHEMLRYLKRLENKDLSLTHSMISLGSCTMKLNATTEMIPITWPELSALHPFVPVEQAEGYQEIIHELEKSLNRITGFTATSLQPNSGAQGEFTGLMVIRAYHESRGDHNRNVTLIPSSAHGTNPASAVMAGTEVVIISCDDRGNIDMADLQMKAEQYSHRLAALMVTYPSTHGVFEEKIRDICGLIHKHGGQVYMDGANMNAQVGLTNPAMIGADVCHLNLHKTFCIPHGGGGPGVGPICVAPHLEPFLPGNPVVMTGGYQPITAVSSAPWGSAGILAISYAYIRMMGAEGLKRASEIAILNANYIKARLEKEYRILYAGQNGHCAHEMIVDCREFKRSGIEVEDIAKRLMDYGFHAPTVSFPVPGTLMIEPTESESLPELDRFCDALLSIREEIREIETGEADMGDNVLKNAPHTQERALADRWKYPYSRLKAVYPMDYLREFKFWPGVARIDSAYGDRNLFCSCIPVMDYEGNQKVKVEEISKTEKIKN